MDTGEWDDENPSEPDFASFEAWLSWLTVALEKEADPEMLGQPTQRVLHFIATTR